MQLQWQHEYTQEEHPDEANRRKRKTRQLQHRTIRDEIEQATARRREEAWMERPSSPSSS